MDYKIVKNESRKSITVILKAVRIPFVAYLYEKFEGERYFATGEIIDASYKEDLVPFFKDMAGALNEVAEKVLQGEKIGISHLFSPSENKNDKDFKLFTKKFDKEGVCDPNQFVINLSSKTNKEDKKFLFTDLKNENPIPKEDGWKHNYAIEFEISAGYDEDELSAYLYAVFHRGISIGRNTETYHEQNDDAWEGFPMDLPF